MTVQANFQKCLGGSPAGFSVSRLTTLTLAAILLIGSAIAGPVQCQAQSNAAKPGQPTAEATPAPAADGKTVGGYLVHQSIELGGRYTSVSGSLPMWSTLFNQSSGGRVLGESIEMRSVNNSKTPFFTDTLSGYFDGLVGGDPLDATSAEKYRRGAGSRLQRQFPQGS